jgi:streptogramin lyase/mono/diheme cytochrome c family protein
MRGYPRLLALISASILLSSVCYSATITGTVKGADGTPFQGAFVEAQNSKTKITVNVLSDGHGHYRVPQLPAGQYRVQIRAVGFSATPQTGVNLTADQNVSFDFSLQGAPVHWSDLSYYQGMKLFPPAKGKDIISKQCSTCHEFETRMASVRRDADGWKDRVQYMRTAMHFSLYHITDQEADDIASYLTSLFGPDSVLPKSAADMPGYKETVRSFSNDAMNIVYVEYDMPGPDRMPFSAAPDKNGMMWIPNFGSANKITRLNPKTGEMQDFPVPNIGPAAIHSAVPAQDGTVWLAEQGTNKLGKWDPTTQKIVEFQDAWMDGHVGDFRGGVKHTTRIAPNGKVWTSGKPTTMFDPETEKFTRMEGSAADTYDVKPDKNGDVWFTAPGLNKIGRIDGKTLKITDWTMPTEGSFPRRMEIADDGIVWIAEFNSGKMARFDTATQTFKEYKLPGPDASPYAMGIDAQGYIWYDSHHQDTVGRVDPKTGQVIEYPFPHSEFCGREFFRDAQGNMWYGTNPNNKVGYFYLTGKGGTMAANKQ